MTMICSGPQCSSDGSAELRKLPLGPGRWDGSRNICRQCYDLNNAMREEYFSDLLPDWEKLAVVKEKQKSI